VRFILAVLALLVGATTAHAKTTFVNVGLALDLPAGWTYQQAGAVDQLTTPGQSPVDVSLDPRACAARPATSATPVWIKPNVWPVAEAVPGGVTLCVQRGTDSLAITVRDNAAEPIVALLADAVIPPVTVGPLVVRFPFFTVAQLEPSKPNSPDTSAFLAVRSDASAPAGIQLTIRTSAAHCSDELVASLGADATPSTITPVGWSPYAFEWKEGRAVCLDLDPGMLVAKYIKGADTGMPLLLEILRVTALATFGSPVVYDGTAELVVPRLAARVPAAPGVGAWKLFDGSEAGFSTSDGFMGLDNPYSVIVAKECINGTTKLAEPEQIFPPSGDGAFSMSSDTRFIATQCVKTVLGSFTVIVIGPHGSPVLTPRGLEKVKAFVAVIEPALGVRVTDPAAPTPPGAEAGPRSGAARAMPFAAYLSGGLATFEPTPTRERYLAPFVSADARLTKGALAFDLGVMLGRGGGELIGEVRTMVGLNLPLGIANVSILGGGGVGSIGPASALDVAVEASVALYSAQSSMLLVRGMRAWGLDAADHDELEVRLLVSRRRDDSSANGFFLGFRYIGFGPSTVEDASLNDVVVANGHALLFSVGLGALATTINRRD